MRWMVTVLAVLSGCSSCRCPSKPTTDAAAIVDAGTQAAVDAASDVVAVETPSLAGEHRPELYGSGFCIVAGYFAYEDFEKAKTLADSIKTAAVYDTRDFTDLAWNQLVVIVGDPAEDRDDLATPIKELLVTVPKARIEGCSPVVAYAMRTSSDVHPLVIADEEINIDFSKDQNPECFGWSAGERAVACIDGHWKESEGGRYEVVFPGSSHPPIVITDWSAPPAPICGAKAPCLKPSATASAAIEAVLKSGAYVEIKTRMHDLDVGKPAQFAKPAVTFRMPKANVVEVECENGAKKVILNEPTAPESIPDADDADHPDVHVRVIPDAKRLLVSYTYETQSGPKVEVERSVIFDPDTDCKP